MKKLVNNQASQVDSDNSELKLNQEQELVRQLVFQGKSIFLTSSAGTGKSFLLKMNKNRTPKSKIRKK